MKNKKILSGNRIVKFKGEFYIALRSNYMTVDWGIYPVPCFKLIAKINSVPQGCENMVV